MKELMAGVRRRDLVLMGVLLAVSLVQLAWLQPLGGPLDGLLYTLVFLVPLAWHRARPMAAALVSTSSMWIPVGDAFLFVGYVAALILFFSLGRWVEQWRLSVLVVGYALATSTMATLLGPEQPVPALFTAWLVVVAPYLFGRLMADQHRDAEDRLAAEREATRQRAVEEERARIVRELHDVVGHEVTLLSIQSEAAAQAVALAPDRAAETVDAVRSTAHRASRELHAILDLLGGGSEVAAPNERGLADLADRAARMGIPNTLTMTGEPWPHAPRHWLAINRIVQECLTNAGKHAPGQSVRVNLDWQADGVSLRVANPAVPQAPARVRGGLGLPGMAERVRLLEGEFDVAGEDDEFRVRVWLPRPGELP